MSHSKRVARVRNLHLLRRRNVLLKEVPSRTRERLSLLLLLEDKQGKRHMKVKRDLRVQKVKRDQQVQKVKIDQRVQKVNRRRLVWMSKRRSTTRRLWAM